MQQPAVAHQAAPQPVQPPHVVPAGGEVISQQAQSTVRVQPHPQHIDYGAQQAQQQPIMTAPIQHQQQVTSQPVANAVSVQQQMPMAGAQQQPMQICM